MAGARLAEQCQAVRQEIVVSAAISQLIANCEAGVTGRAIQKVDDQFLQFGVACYEGAAKNRRDKKQYLGEAADEPP
jgi:hypothetical protein